MSDLREARHDRERTEAEEAGWEINKCIVRRCPCDCDWIPASDPTPDLRGRLENAVRDNLLSTTPYFELAITKIAAAVLVVLGEPDLYSMR